jgi:phage head maturation protease
MTTAASRTTQRAERPPTDRLLRVAPFGLVRAADPGTDGEPGDGLTLDGYAAVFNRETLIDSWEGRFWEQTAPGSMKKTFREQTPRIQFDHGTHPLIGSIPIAAPRTVEEATDPVLAPEGGAHVVARLFDNWLMAPVRDAIDAGAINGMSFRFSVVKEEWRDAEGKLLRDPEQIQQELFRSWYEDLPAEELLHRSLRELRVPELGPVVWPAYEETSVGVRSTSVTIDLAAARAGDSVERRKIADTLFQMDTARALERVRDVVKNFPTPPDGVRTVVPAEEVVPATTADDAAGGHTEASEPAQPGGTAERAAQQPPTTGRPNEKIHLDRIRSKVTSFPTQTPPGLS